ncbi:MAG: hotdog fold domain-containing protein [Actinobacteria bacterium]|nr:hotdog fold domain-containing protein [Actinomycetota bacterium]
MTSPQSRGRAPATTPPDSAIIPERHPLAPAPGEPIDSHYEQCFGCGARHPTGLHLVVTAGQGLTVHGEFRVSEHHQGGPGLAHGGLLTTAFDEVLGSLNWLLRMPSVTGRLEVDFRRPVPVDSVLHLEAEIIGQAGRKVYTRGVGRLNSVDGQVALTAAALFVQVDLAHFRDNGRQKDLEAALRSGQVKGALERLELNP